MTRHKVLLSLSFMLVLLLPRPQLRRPTGCTVEGTGVGSGLAGAVAGSSSPAARTPMWLQPPLWLCPCLLVDAATAASRCPTAWRSMSSARDAWWWPF